VLGPAAEFCAVGPEATIEHAALPDGSTPQMSRRRRLV
jgi:hypothetical protein